MTKFRSFVQLFALAAAVGATPAFANVSASMAIEASPVGKLIAPFRGLQQSDRAIMFSAAEHEAGTFSDRNANMCVAPWPRGYAEHIEVEASCATAPHDEISGTLEVGAVSGSHVAVSEDRPGGASSQYAMDADLTQYAAASQENT